MVNLTINKQPISVPEGTTILEATRRIGMPVPTLCFLKDINEIAACRVCVVEVKGIERLVTACNNTVHEGMEVFTNTARVREARKTNVELILSQHHTNCPTCIRSGNCTLQKIANDLNLVTDRYKTEYAPVNWTQTFPLFKDAGKCIKCMRCVQICDKIQGLGIWDVEKTGSRTNVDVSYSREIKMSDCALCGQCITHCPTAALQERDDVSRIFEMSGDLNNPDKITVVQIAPAVRAAWGEEFGLSREYATDKRLVAALRRMGFDYIFDTNFSADLTIMEEGTEFLERLAHRDEHKWPMFTSCCPGWVRFLKSQYPDMVDNLSTAKSPQQMFGAVAKTYFAEKIGVDPHRMFVVSIMPCTAKKYEVLREEQRLPNGCMPVDVSLTTRELGRMITQAGLLFEHLPDGAFDPMLGVSTGAAAIFGASGGVMEAALRTVVEQLTGEGMAPLEYQEVRGMEGVKEASYELPGKTVRVCVASGLHNVKRVLDGIRDGSLQYDFVEFMACPGGCINGGGQPIQHANVRNFTDIKALRAAALYKQDEGMTYRRSHENPVVQKVYADFLGEPGGHKAHALLHCSYIKQKRYRV